MNALFIFYIVLNLIHSLYLSTTPPPPTTTTPVLCHAHMRRSRNTSTGWGRGGGWRKFLFSRPIFNNFKMNSLNFPGEGGWPSWLPSRSAHLSSLCDDKCVWRLRHNKDASKKIYIYIYHYYLFRNIYIRWAIFL